MVTCPPEPRPHPQIQLPAGLPASGRAACPLPLPSLQSMPLDFRKPEHLPTSRMGNWTSLNKQGRCFQYKVSFFLFFGLFIGCSSSTILNLTISRKASRQVWVYFLSSCSFWQLLSNEMCLCGPESTRSIGWIMKLRAMPAWVILTPALSGGVSPAWLLTSAYRVQADLVRALITSIYGVD